MSGTALFICHGKKHRKLDAVNFFKTVEYVDVNPDQDPDYTDMSEIKEGKKYDNIFSVSCPANTGDGINAKVIFNPRILLHLKGNGRYFVNNLFTMSPSKIEKEAAKYGFIFVGFMPNIIDDKAARLVAAFISADGASIADLSLVVRNRGFTIGAQKLDRESLLALLLQ